MPDALLRHLDIVVSVHINELELLELTLVEVLPREPAQGVACQVDTFELLGAPKDWDLSSQ